jgi:hypothetical protein
MPSGVYRRVILVWQFAVKVPHLHNALSGLRCNRWEREMWRVWRPAFGWKNLCPIEFSDPLGFIVVMPRATQPVTIEEVDEAIGDYYPDITSESKAADFGRVDGRVLALDYGLSDAKEIHKQRSLYIEHLANH